MNITIRRTIGSTVLRFGVSFRRKDSADDATLWSTGPNGELAARSSAPLFYTEQSRSDDTRHDLSSGPEGRRWLGSSFSLPVLAGLAAGGFLMLIGVLVLIRKGGIAGPIEILLGAAIAAAPFLVSAKRRREERAAAERERQARAEEEARRRALIRESYRELENLPPDPDPVILERVRERREARETPYELIAPLARDVILRAAFHKASQSEPPLQIARTLDELAHAIGLTDEDRHELKTQLYQRLLWHLLADGRASEEHAARLEELRHTLGVSESDVEIDRRAFEQFHTAQHLDPNQLPESHCERSLQYQEKCLLTTPTAVLEGRSLATRLRRQAATDGEGTLMVTSKRIVLEPRGLSLPFARIQNLELDADEAVLTIHRMDKRRPVRVRLGEPIHVAGLIQIAASLPRKPASLL